MDCSALEGGSEVMDQSSWIAQNWSVYLNSKGLTAISFSPSSRAVLAFSTAGGVLFNAN